MYKEEYLKELDKKQEMIPLYYDQMFKTVMEKNNEIFKKFLIETLHLNIDDTKCKIIFLDKELIKETNKEHGKTIDIYVKINEKFVIDIELNYNFNEEVMARNSIYLDKLRSNSIEINEEYKNIFEYHLYQLNLNKGSFLYPNGENIIVSYDITTNTIFPDHKKIIMKNLDYYRGLYYNLNRNLSFDEMFLVALTTKNFTELSQILSKILNKKDKDKFLESVINMSTNEFILHEWQKDKLDKWEKYHREKRLIEQNKIDTIKAMLKKNISYKDISDITGKSIEEIKEIEKNSH